MPACPDQNLQALALGSPRAPATGCAGYRHNENATPGEVSFLCLQAAGGGIPGLGNLTAGGPGQDSEKVRANTVVLQQQCVWANSSAVLQYQRT